MSDISFPINISLNDYRSHHAGRMYKHYAHAREKHPYFCDRLLPRTMIENYFAMHLADVRRSLAKRITAGSVIPETILECEMAEIFEALECGDKAQAVKECYDLAAVALRLVDAIEGRQKLGKPETKGEAK